jgi:3-hydroxyacyl-[acyl-carrier-protein] dehydratase
MLSTQTNAQCDAGTQKQATMKSYQHEFEKVEDYLHHRPPYLMVEEIVSVSNKEIVTQKTVSGDEFFIKGHFPGAPIFPGAMMQELATQSAGILIAAKHNPMKEYNTEDPFFNEYALGVLVRVKQARYIGFARPGDTLTAKVVLNETVSNVFDFSANIKVDGKLIMRNAFQLTNIKSSVLQGVAQAD